MIIDIVHNQEHLDLIGRLLLMITLCDQAVIQMFEEDFQYIEMDHLATLRDKLLRGEVQGDCSAIRYVPDVHDHRDQFPYGDFFAIIGEEIRLMNGYTSDIDDPNYQISYELYERIYGLIEKRPYFEWMRRIKRGDTPKNSKVSKLFFDAVDRLLDSPDLLIESISEEEI